MVTIQCICVAMRRAAAGITEEASNPGPGEGGGGAGGGCQGGLLRGGAVGKQWQPVKMEMDQHQQRLTGGS